MADQGGIGIDSGDAGAKTPLIIESVGDIGVEIVGDELCLTTDETGAVIVIKIGRQTEVGKQSRAPGPLIIDGLDQVHGRDEGIRRYIVGIQITGTDTHRRNVITPPQIDIRASVGSSHAHLHRIKASHGCRIASQYRGIIGDGSITSKSTTQAGSRVFVQVEGGGSSLLRGRRGEHGRQGKGEDMLVHAL